MSSFVCADDSTKIPNCIDNIRSEEDLTQILNLLFLYDAMKTWDSVVMEQFLEGSIGDDPETRPHLDSMFAHDVAQKEIILELFKLVFIGITQKAIIDRAGSPNQESVQADTAISGSHPVEENLPNCTCLQDKGSRNKEECEEEINVKKRKSTSPVPMSTRKTTTKRLKRTRTRIARGSSASIIRDPKQISPKMLAFIMSDERIKAAYLRDVSSGVLPMTMSGYDFCDRL